MRTIIFCVTVLICFSSIGFVHCQVEFKDDFENKKLSIFKNKCDSGIELPTIDTLDFNGNPPPDGSNQFYAIVKENDVKCFETSYYLVPSNLKLSIQRIGNNDAPNIDPTSKSEIEVKFIKRNGDEIKKIIPVPNNNKWEIDSVNEIDLGELSLNFVKIRVKITSSATDVFAINYISFDAFGDNTLDLGSFANIADYVIAAAALIISLVVISAISFLCMICFCITFICKMNSLEKSNDRLTTTVLSASQPQIGISTYTESQQRQRSEVSQQNQSPPQSYSGYSRQPSQQQELSSPYQKSPQPYPGLSQNYQRSVTQQGLSSYPKSPYSGLSSQYPPSPYAKPNGY